MKQFNKLFLLLLVSAFALNANAQTRYLDDLFTGVSVSPDVPYATNISVLTGGADTIPLVMDIYTPDGDDATDRPVVVYFHTGSFLPQYFNGQITGNKQDSTCAEICRRLARKGYVAISATYRAGWVPTATGPEGQNTRTGTLLNAAYRGIQDARSLIRYLRKTVAEDENPYGINTDNITLWGQGTGGYLSYGCAYLDDFAELALPKFVNTEDLSLYVDSNLVGDIFGLKDAPLALSNWPGYSSDFKLAVNAGGALGDSTWIDGTDNEPATIGFHVFADPFAPYETGPVIVPVTGDFVVDVVGTRFVTNAANENGANAIFMEANQDLSDPINAINTVYSNTPAATIFGDPLPSLSVANMYPFLTDTLASGPWEWWGYEELAGQLAFFNTVAGTSFDVDEFDATGRILNPDASKEKAMAYIDTMVNFFLPRAYLALDLATSVKEIITPESVSLTVGPNPIQDVALVSSAPDKPMQRVAIYNLDGKMMRGITNLNASQFELKRMNLPAGIYLLQAEFEEGVVTKKVMFK